MLRPYVWGLVFMMLTVPVSGQEKKESGEETPAAEQYRALVGEYFTARNRWFVESRKAKTPDERREAMQFRPKVSEFADRFLKLAEEHRGSGAAGDALVWVASNAARAPQGAKAIPVLAEQHAGHRGLDAVCQALVYDDTPAAELLFRKVLEENRHASARGQATYSLAKLLSRKQQKDEAKQLLKQVIDDYADVRHRFGGTLGAEASRDLYELQHLQVGMVAPDITGKDIDGEEFKLSDYRGRVVLICFTGSWCAPCRALYPHHRELVEKLADKPFTLLAVNSDRDPQLVKAAQDQGEITWRSWWDGGGKIPQRGPIGMRWNVNGWPTIYVLDQEGVIRLHKVGATPLDKTTEQLDAEIEGLLTEAEKAS